MASQSDQTSQGSPPFLEFTSASMPPNPTHKYIGPPPGRQPIAWSKITKVPVGNVSQSGDSVASQSSGMSAQSNQQSAYKKVRFNSVLQQVSSMSAHKEVIWTVSCHKSAAGCRIKQETRLCHSPVACQRNPTSKKHTRKSDSTVSHHKPAACQHTRQSVLTVSCRSSAASCRIKQVMGGRHSPVAGQSCRKSAADCRIIPTTKGYL
jgi:hypothetical protein